MNHELIGKKFPVLDHGHVVLVDYMGSDHDIVEAARTSYQKGTVKVSDDRTLIRYLMRHRHTTPIESAVLKFHIKLPIFVERQMARSRTAGWSEVSARYSELPEEYYVPELENIQTQSKVNNQGRGEFAGESVAEQFQVVCRDQLSGAFDQYHSDLRNGIARELARINLPVSVYTEKVWWINLHNLFHLLSLRMDSHAQWEIREYADIMGYKIVSELFPLAWEAFLDYRLNSKALTGLDIDVVSSITNAVTKGNATLPVTEEVFMQHQHATWTSLDRCRERDECYEKLTLLGICERK